VHAGQDRKNTRLCDKRIKKERKEGKKQEIERK
jgi:hypothetical protein